MVEPNPRAVSLLDNLQRRVSRLETLEAGVGGVGGFTLIETIRLTAEAAEFKFDNIPQTYQHLFWDSSLRCRWIGPFTGSSFPDVFLQMNGDTAANYAWGAALGAAFYSQAVSETRIRVGRMPTPGSGIPTYNENYASAAGWINHYQSTAKKTSITHHGGMMAGTSGEVPRTFLLWKGSGVWDSLDAINELRFHAWVGVSSVVYRAHSRISLYGVGQASS